MTPTLYTDIDRYLESHLLARDEALEAALRSIAEAGLPNINVAPNQGKLLAVFIKMIGARRVLEIGTLAGYSTLWMGAALPASGALVTLEIDPRHAAVARANLERARLPCSVELRVGPALELLAQLESEGAAPFDLFFIDADKQNIPSYFNWALRLSHPGSVIVVDNVIRQGRILDPNNEDPNLRGVRALYELIAHEPRVFATAVQTVGSKGHDGFLIATVS